MCFLRVQSQDLPRYLAFRDDQSRDGLCAKAAHCLQAMPAVGGPEATAGRNNGDDRVEETSSLIDDIGQPFVVSVREIALKRRGLDLVYGKNREQGRMSAKRILIEAHHAAPSLPDCFHGFFGRSLRLF